MRIGNEKHNFLIAGVRWKREASITVKFSGSLPTAKPAPNKKVEVELTDQNGIIFTALLNAKSWRKAEANAKEFADWAGAISGKLGQRTANGFEVVDAGAEIAKLTPAAK